MMKLPDPKTIVDAVGDGAVSLLEAPVRIAENVAGVAQTYASETKANMEEVKSRMPDDLGVIPEVVIKQAAQTVKAFLGGVRGFGKAAMDTFDAVDAQIKRITG